MGPSAPLLPLRASEDFQSAPWPWVPNGLQGGKRTSAQRPFSVRSPPAAAPRPGDGSTTLPSEALTPFTRAPAPLRPAVGALPPSGSRRQLGGRRPRAQPHMEGAGRAYTGRRPGNAAPGLTGVRNKRRHVRGATRAGGRCHSSCCLSSGTQSPLQGRCPGAGASTAPPGGAHGAAHALLPAPNTFSSGLAAGLLHASHSL